MFWIILTTLVTVIAIRFIRRFSWFPAHILGLEGYEWADDTLNWTILHYDWTKLCDAIIDSVQEQFKQRALSGWSLKFEGRPSFTVNPQLGKGCLWNGENANSNAGLLQSSSEVTETTKFVTSGKEQGTGKTTPTTTINKANLDLWNKTPTEPTAGKRVSADKTKKSACTSYYPFFIRRVQTLTKSPYEVILAVDVRMCGWSHNVCVTCRQANQLQSSKCRLDLIDLTGNVKVRVSDAYNENMVCLSACFSGTPNVNITISDEGSQKEETRLVVEKLLRESISSFSVKLPLFNTSFIEKQPTDREHKSFLPSLKRQQIPQKEDPPQIIGFPNKIVIKVLKANALYDKGNHETYCLVSIDSPLQSKKTSSVADSPNPFFDELLTFRADETTKKVSFVVQDKNNPAVTLGRADLFLKDVPQDANFSNRGVRLVLPLMAQLATSHMSLTLEVSSVRDKSDVPQGLNISTRQILTHMDGVKPGQALQPNSAHNPSINIQEPAVLSSGSSDQSPLLSPSQSLSRKSPTYTDSNLSLVSQGSLMIRNNENASNVSAASTGRPKRRSFIDKVRNRFRSKQPRSKSAEISNNQRNENLQETKVFSDGIYLTPPPKRITPGQHQPWSLHSSTTLQLNDKMKNKKRVKIPSFRNIFRKHPIGSPESTHLQLPTSQLTQPS